ncbi:MAG TPA: hypothetical protein VMS32_06925 [Verrucomicrobiae bacterium]|jgi:hypothetical protein|nr:hypothetical protein [Verrucomicrobiae bacterium]
MTAIAALPLFAEPARALAATQGLLGDTPLPPIPTGLSPANLRAAQLAHDSPFVRAQFSGIRAMANSISDSWLKSDANGLLDDPSPRYARKYPTQASRIAMRDKMAAAGFVPPNAPVEGIFPRGTDRAGIVQPFWSTPGSADDSHHAYPGGLVVHELFNGRMAAAAAHTYDGIYFSKRKEVDHDLVTLAALYHDVMKTVVFQYNFDGTFTKELNIGDTGGHHVLSGAEAIVRGHDARFVTTLLSAHAAPSLGDEKKVATWCAAAAMLAGVDPVAFGLLSKNADGTYRLAALPPMECFVNFLSDHDWPLTVYAAQAIRPYLDALAPTFGAKTGDASALAWWRLAVTSKTSIVALYHELTRGESAFAAAVKTAGAVAA